MKKEENLLYKSVVVFRVNLYVDDSSIWKISTEVAEKQIRQNLLQVLRYRYLQNLRIYETVTSAYKQHEFDNAHIRPG
jgi:hypothetical protein